MWSAGVIIVLIIVLVWWFRPATFDAPVAYVDSIVGREQPAAPSSVSSAPKEHMSSGRSSSLPAPISDALFSMGYTGSVPWDEVIQATEVDPATHASQAEFVRDVRRYSSGANFTAVADDNNNMAYTNFVGLNRPQAVAIGSSARQQPDVDQSVLERNKLLRW